MSHWLLCLVLACWVGTSWGVATTVNDARVAATDVAHAIRSSPNASPQLKQYAEAIGNLAMFESGGRLSVYNGSCCYGVLQLTSSNIKAALGMSTDTFRRLPLQDQVDAWATIMSKAIRDPVVGRLSALGTFDGRKVDGNMVLACVQLGQANCMTMLRSGRCGGFSDLNGTTICRMADQIAGGATSPAATTPTSAVGDLGLGSTGPVTGYGGSYTGAPKDSCISDGYGHCASISASIAKGFKSGSGVTMDELRNVIQMLTVAGTLLIMGSALTGLWREYADGSLSQVDVINGIRKAFIAVLIIGTIITVV